MTTTLLAGSLVLALLALCELAAPVLAVASGERDATADGRPTATPTPALVRDSARTRAARDALVREVERRDPGLSARTLDALRAVPRHLFMPEADVDAAYGNHAFGIGHGQTISQPTVVAIMSDALELRGDERVLEVGTGSGYQAAVLARLAREVYSVEIVPALAEESARRLAALGYTGVHVKQGDGYQGWPEHAPFDRIILTAAPPELPAKLVEQLVDGGIVVAPVGEDDQHLYRWTKRDGRLSREHLGAVRFVPMVTPGKTR